MKLVFWIAVFATLLAVQAQAIDLQPGDVRAPKPGLNSVQLFYQYSERGTRYLHGVAQAGDSQIQVAQAQMRLGRSFSVADFPAFTYLQTAVGYVHPGGTLAQLEGDSGTTDTVLAQALWPYANLETQTYFGVAAYLIVPTGSYSTARRFNLGENRYRWALQLGYQAPLTEHLLWMTAVDALWFGDNDSVGHNHDSLEQRTLYSGQLSLRYDFNPHYAVGASYFHTVGGETRLNGTARDDGAQLQRYQVTGIATFPVGRISLSYGSDLDTENGYIEDQRWLLRYALAF